MDDLTPEEMKLALEIFGNGDKPRTYRYKTNITFQGKPCRKCGGTERYQSNRQCITCHRLRNRIRMIEKRKLINE